MSTEVSTIRSGPWFQAERGTESSPIIEAPAFLDLAGAGGFRDVLRAGRAPYITWGQRRSLAPDGLRGAGVVHPNAVTEAHLPTGERIRGMI